MSTHIRMIIPPQEASFVVDIDTSFDQFQKVVISDPRKVSIDNGNLKLAFESVSDDTAHTHTHACTHTHTHTHTHTNIHLHARHTVDRKG